MKSLKSKNILIICLLLIILLTICFLSICIGNRGLLNLENSLDQKLLVDRINRTFTGLLAGSALSLSGWMIQNLTQNSLSDASLLGINSTSSLAVVIALTIVPNINSFTLPIFSSIGASLCLLIILFISKLIKNRNTLILFGSCISLFAISIINLIIIPNNNLLEQYRFWQLGSIARGNPVYILPLFIIGIIISLPLVYKFKIIVTNLEHAQSMGVNIKKLSYYTVISSSLLIGSICAFCGPIGFVGLLIPNIAKKIVSVVSFAQWSIVGLLGANVLILADIIGRIIIPKMELNVGIIMNIIGGIILIIIFVKKEKL